VRPVLATVDNDQVGFSAVDPVAMPQLVDIKMTAGGFDGMTDDDGTVIFKDKAKDLGVGMGDKVHIVFSIGVERDVTIVGIFGDNSLGSPLWISIGLLDAVSDQAPVDQLVLARADDGVDPDVAKQQIEQAVAEFPQAEVKTNAEFRQDQEGQIDQLLVVISTLLAFAIIISFFGIAVTLALSVFERTREIGLLRAVGMSRRQLRRAVRWEAVIVSVFGVVVGVVVGTLIGLALAYAVPNTVIDGITIPYATIIEVIVLAVIAAVIFALYPAYKASRMNVLDAIATE
jgi:putative ABC transport system permease protein